MTQMPPVLTERVCGECAHFEPYPYEPPLGRCHALNRIQHANSQPLTFGCVDFQPQEHTA